MNAGKRFLCLVENWKVILSASPSGRNFAVFSWDRKKNFRFSVLKRVQVSEIPPYLQEKQAKIGVLRSNRPTDTAKNAIHSRKKFFLFIYHFFRYHNAREVATNKIRNTVTQEEGYDQLAQQWNERAYSSCIRSRSARLDLCSSLPFQD